MMTAAKMAKDMKIIYFGELVISFIRSNKICFGTFSINIWSTYLDIQNVINVYFVQLLTIHN